MQGIDPQTLKYGFSQIPEEMDETSAMTVPDPEARFRASPEGASYIRDRFSKPEHFIWAEHWRHVPAEDLLKIFSLEGCARLWHSEGIMSEMTDFFEEKHPVIAKVSNSHWRYGFSRSWNGMVRQLEGLSRLNFGVPDFDVRIAHTGKYNTNAYSEQVRDLYLDACFGALIHYKGEHVLTVGFAFLETGILVAQVQLRHAKGNRFLYKLPKHYMDLSLEMLKGAFPDDPLYLIEGKSAAEAVRRSYSVLPATFTTEIDNRLGALYNRPLADFTRNSFLVSYNSRSYTPLQPAPNKSPYAYQTL